MSDSGGVLGQTDSLTDRGERFFALEIARGHDRPVVSDSSVEGRRDVARRPLDSRPAQPARRPHESAHGIGLLRRSSIQLFRPSGTPRLAKLPGPRSSNRSILKGMSSRIETVSDSASAEANPARENTAAIAGRRSSRSRETPPPRDLSSEWAVRRCRCPLAGPPPRWPLRAKRDGVTRIPGNGTLAATLRRRLPPSQAFASDATTLISTQPPARERSLTGPATTGRTIGDPADTRRDGNSTNKLDAVMIND